MTRNTLIRALVTVLIVCGAGISANASSLTFNFNSLSVSTGDNSAAVASSMTSALTAAGCSGCSVTVTGAATDQQYNGEGYVTGPGNGSKSLTLGTSDGATASNSNSTVNTLYDTFLANTTDGSSQISQEISIKINGIVITAASFDYEIFPDGTCPQLNASNCGGNPVNGIYPNQPDFDFEAGTNSNGTDSLVTGFGTNGTQYGVTPGTTDGNAIHSPNSGSGGTDVAPQYIGTWSGSLNNVNELDFIDWPATIGIDNLVITYTTTQHQTPVPEPPVSEMLAVFLGSALFFRRKLWALPE